METKEVKIQIPEGYEIDKEKSTFEKIVFKKKENSKPRSWEEYCKQQITRKEIGYYFTHTDCTSEEISWNEYSISNDWRNVLPSKELAEAFLAMMQLMSLRQAWIGDWKPDWSGEISKPCINFCGDYIKVCPLAYVYKPLSFPTTEMAEDFINCFKDLLEIAKPLL